MKVNRTEQIYIRENSTLSRMCHLSKNLYNQVNYMLKQQFLNHEKLSGYNELAKQFSIPSDMEEHNNYQKLPAQTAQWTIRKAVQSWNSFFRALKTWKKHPDIFKGTPFHGTIRSCHRRIDCDMLLFGKPIDPLLWRSLSVRNFT